MMGEYADKAPINESLQDYFFERWDFWQNKLDCEQDLIKLDAIIPQICEELGALCPFADEKVIMTGKAVLPKIEEGEHIGDFMVEVELLPGIHRGVQVISSSEDSTNPKIMHWVQTSTRNENNGTVVNITNTFGYFGRDASIFMIDKVDEAFGYESTVFDLDDDGMKTLNKFSEKLIDIYRSTKFRRQNKGAQQRFVTGFIDEVNARLPIRDKILLVEAQYAYVPDIQADGVRFVRLPINDIVEVQCMGLDTIELSHMQEKPIRRDADMVDKMAGLCLLADLDPESRQRLGVSINSLVWLPLGGQSLESVELDYYG